MLRLLLRLMRMIPRYTNVLQIRLLARLQRTRLTRTQGTYRPIVPPIPSIYPTPSRKYTPSYTK